jgi:hypothetical protein
MLEPNINIMELNENNKNDYNYIKFEYDIKKDVNKDVRI